MPRKTADSSPRLSPQHELAWRNQLRVNALLVRALDADLRAQHGMTLVTYDALVQLSEAPGRRLYMKDLAEALVYSASGLTRLVDALERDGYARREPDPSNRRATLVVLTDAGQSALDEAWSTHVAGVSERFAQWISDEQAEVIGEAFGAVRRQLDE